MSLLSGLIGTVTGGANGIGRAIVERLVQEGATVAVVDREPIPDLGAAVKPFQFDLSATEGLASLVDDVEAAVGPLDVLVNNAGIFEPMLAVRPDARVLPPGVVGQPRRSGVPGREGRTGDGRTRLRTDRQHHVDSR